jgi:hypothetical protein
MSKKELLLVIRESLEEERRSGPEQTFQRMVEAGLINADGQPAQRERKLFVSKDRAPEPEDGK